MEEISQLKLFEYKKELKELQESIPLLATKKAEARAEGDLKENAEYDFASAELSKAQLRAAQLFELIDNCKVIVPDKGLYITLGCFVRIKCLNKELLGEQILRLDNEGNILAKEPYNRVLSVHSALGSAILNGVSGEYTIQTEAGEIRYQVDKVPLDEIKRIWDLDIM